jgi:putative ABC transport system permease protein
MRTPLAWLQLIREKTRVLVAIAGISFADVLIFMQLGFQGALLDTNIRLHKTFKGDLFLMSPQSDSIVTLEKFSRRRLYQALAVEGVESVIPVYIGIAPWKNPLTSQKRSLMVLAFNPREQVLAIPELQSSIDAIKLSDTILFDELSQRKFGPIAEQFRQGKTITTEINGRRIKVGGLFPLGVSFTADGNIITSDVNFFRLFSERNPGLIDLGMIKLESGADLESVLEDLRKRMPQDVKVISKAEFIKSERDYWNKATSIGFIFSLGTGVGFIVGIVIVYQILYNDVADHLPEYATLKAIGYPDRYFVLVVFQEAIILALLGYIPGLSLAMVLYLFTESAIGISLGMSLLRALTVLLLTMTMCFLSGTIAIRKLKAADPVDIF